MLLGFNLNLRLLLIGRYLWVFWHEWSWSWWNQNCVSLYLIKFIVDVQSFFWIDLHDISTLLAHRFVPEYVAFNFLVTYPAMVLLVSYDLPLACPRNVKLMVEVASKNQFGVNGDEFVLSWSILHDPFSIIDVLNLHGFSQPCRFISLNCLRHQAVDQIKLAFRLNWSCIELLLNLVLEWICHSRVATQMHTLN